MDSQIWETKFRIIEDISRITERKVFNKKLKEIFNINPEELHRISKSINTIRNEFKPFYTVPPSTKNKYIMNTYRNNKGNLKFKESTNRRFSSFRYGKKNLLIMKKTFTKKYDTSFKANERNFSLSQNMGKLTLRKSVGKHLQTIVSSNFGITNISPSLRKMLKYANK